MKREIEVEMKMGFKRHFEEQRRLKGKLRQIVKVKA